MTSIDQTTTKMWRLSPDLRGLVNLDGFFETNPAWQAVLGWSEEEIRSKTFIDFLHPDDIDRTVALFEHMKQGGSALHFENRYQCKDGSYRWLSWVAAQEGDIFFCSARDISHDKEPLNMLKTSQDALKANEQRLRLALDIAGIGIWELDMASDQVAWDQRQFELFGLPEVEGNIPLSASTDVIHPDDREQLNETAKKVFEGGKAARSEFRVVHPDGSIRWLLGCSSIIESDESLRPGLLVGVNMDITAVKETEIALRKSRDELDLANKEKDKRAENLVAANKELEFQSAEKGKRAEELLRANIEKEDLIAEAERANAAKSDFLATVSHELRTPLTSIKGSIDLLQSGHFGALSSKAERLLAIAQRNSDRLLSLVNDILDFNSLDAGQLKPDRVRMSADDTLLDALNINSPLVLDKEVTLVHTPTNVPFDILADQRQVQQVLSNLISNAVKVSPKGGVVEVYAAIEGDSGVFRVKDSGVGISERFWSAVFDRFTQEDGSDTRKVAGSGLCLAIAKSIVENHGGAIYFETELGVGTTFSFTMPLA
jgi:PAS domain S-box-containing protein